MPFESLLFDPVPEPKTVKNRIHWDVYGDVDDFIAAGATVLAEQPRWTVLADPEGNEFCVFPVGVSTGRWLALAARPPRLDGQPLANRRRLA